MGLSTFFTIITCGFQFRVDIVRDHDHDRVHLHVYSVQVMFFTKPLPPPAVLSAYRNWSQRAMHKCKLLRTRRGIASENLDTSTILSIIH
jgi:hypothetical protein